MHRGTKGTLWEGGTRGITFVHYPSVIKPGIKNGLFHIVDWTPTLASIAGMKATDLENMRLDGINQKGFIFEDSESKRDEFVYNLKTAPFKAGYRMGKYKLLWGEHSKGGWYGESFHKSQRNLKINWEKIQQKLVTDWNFVNLEEEDWDLDDEKRKPSENPVEDFAEISKDQPIMLFNVEHDPIETNDISKENQEVVKTMIDKILRASKSIRRGNFEPRSVLGHPFFHGGNFMPGWCKPED